MRVFLGCGDIASFLTRLAPALGRHKEIKNCYLFSTRLHPHYANPYQSEDSSFTLVFKRLVISLVALTHTKIGRTVGAPFIAASWLLLRLAIVIWAVFKVDVFLFVSGKSLLPFGLDARLFRRLGKRVVHVYLGTSSRPRFMSARWEKKFGTPESKKWLKKLEKRISRQVKRLRSNGRSADVVIDNPLCGHYHTSSFVDWFHVGFPGKTDQGNVIFSAPDLTVDSVRILHCPSVPRIKGSFEIGEIIEELKKEGYSIEFIQLTGVPRARVLEEIRQCDFVIDQLYSDSPLAGFASEAAESGKMAIVGGYGWHALERWMPNGMPNRGLCEPSDLKRVLKNLIEARSLLPGYGKEAFDFADGYWKENKVADRVVRIMQDDIPDDWFCDPSDLDYYMGLGADKEHRLRVIHALIEQCGPESLGPVSDKLLRAVRIQ